jgi:hypothetical protein
MKKGFQRQRAKNGASLGNLSSLGPSLGLFNGTFTCELGGRGVQDEKVYNSLEFSRNRNTIGISKISTLENIEQNSRFLKTASPKKTESFGNIIFKAPSLIEKGSKRRDKENHVLFSRLIDFKMKKPMKGAVNKNKKPLPINEESLPISEDTINNNYYDKTLLQGYEFKRFSRITIFIVLINVFISVLWINGRSLFSSILNKSPLRSKDLVKI